MADMKSLVIVESPAKAKTIEKYLGPGFVVKSSIGHIRDLPKSDLGIDIEKNFTPKYEVSSDKKKVISELKKLVKDAEKVWLATDEDREGEAIAWHLYETLKLSKKDTSRIVFHEITKSAIQEAIKNPRKINDNVVNAQQARRVLDRLVGYKLSPVLWKKVKYGLSAGRVQSVTVRLIVEREREIDTHIADSSYKVTAVFILDDGTKLSADLKTKFKTKEEAREFLDKIKNSDFKVKDLTKKPAIRRPAPPFTTSTLQQEASRKLSFSVKQTMMLAQRLYENGHITYMRTDSVNLSKFAIGIAKDMVVSEYGAEYSKTRNFATKTAGAQEAHEAIRPSDFSKKTAGGDANQKRLYDLIWKRAIASQMSDAKLEKTTVLIEASGAKELFQASGEVILFDGFIKVYMESRKEGEEDKSSKLLPPLEVNQILNNEKVTAKETFKKPPFRYSEASLVKKLEEMGIGRPSTYAPTISTVQDRGYVVKEDVLGQEGEAILLTLANGEIAEEKVKENAKYEKAKLLPTDIGGIVNDFLVKHFPEVVDYKFTATIEEEFDEVAQGKKIWYDVIEEFYTPFEVTLVKAEDVSREEATQSRNLGIDPKTEKPIFAKVGRFGPMFQLGETESEEKPRFAAIPKNKKFDKVTIEDALPLFDLPRDLGQSPDGYKVVTQIGRFGPYIRCNKTFVSIKEEELFSIELEEAMVRVHEKEEEKRKNQIADFPDEGIQVLNGRYGPYVTDGKKNVKIPKTIVAEDLTLEECKKMIAEAPAKKKRVTRRTKK